MKYLLIFALISLAAACKENELTEKKFAIYEKECQIEAGVSDAENADTTVRDPEPRNMQCMRYCIFKKWGMMNGAGQLVNDYNAKKTLAFLLKGSTTGQVASSIIDSCCGVVGSDHCETASAYAKCILTELKNREISSNLV